MIVKVKEWEEHHENQTLIFDGLSGEIDNEGCLCFDAESKAKLPKWWIKLGEKEGFDPYKYTFRKENLEIID